jgi:hypothetical protein
MYMEHGKDTVIYDLRGFRGEGFDWLEYHRPDGTGGGAIMLRTGTPSVRSGLIMAGHCDTGNLRCYANRWVRVGNDFDFSDPNLVPAYKSQWLRKPVDVSPNELDSLPAEAPRRKSE